jgi:hypothetical protein
MIGTHLHESLSCIPGVRAFAHCDPQGGVVLRGGETISALDAALPKILHLASELGHELGLGTLREAELHGQLHALCLPCEDGAVMVETGSRTALADVSQRLHAMQA